MTSVGELRKRPINKARSAIKEKKQRAKFINKRVLSNITMVGTITIRKDAIMDLVRVKDEFDSIVESLELMSNKEFMDSYKKAKEQIKKRDFDDWNEL